MSDSPPETRASLLVKLRDHQNASAWQDFTDLYTPVIRKTELRMGLQVADVENVVQEVLLAVSQSIDQWLDNPQRGSFRGWLSRIAKNKTLDLLTRKATRPENGISREWDAIPAAISSLSSCWDQEYRWELFAQAAKHVREAVAEATWQAFWLSTIENQPAGDVARQLGVRQGMVYLSRCRVLDRIRKLVKQWESEE
ncbi:MAG: sigma-70 family RNA polymerase sigma factor [Planctomycetota bacterium]|nr:sigma-70 family RNA polymerase sigma factor [Planctomycetota bacterium]